MEKGIINEKMNFITLNPNKRKTEQNEIKRGQ